MTQVLEDVAASLRDPVGLDDTLRQVTRTAVERLDGVDYASVTIMHSDGRIETVAPSDEMLRRLDAAQYELREGPCYEAVTDSGVVRSTDVRIESRWPRYGPIAAEAGIRSQVGVELFSSRGARGGLNLYSRQPDAFPYRTQLIELYATTVGMVIEYARELDTLKQALETRKVIGQALGLVMQRYNLPEDRAFAVLVRMSQTANVKLRDIAVEMVAAAGRSTTHPE